MKRVQLKTLLKNVLKEQTTPYTGDNVLDTSKGEPIKKYKCIEITKPGHVSGLKVGSTTCVESPDGEYSSIDECRLNCKGSDDVSPYTPFSCLNLETWLADNSGPAGSDALFAGATTITPEIWCEALCTQNNIYQQFPVICDCCKKTTCFTCDTDGETILSTLIWQWEECPENYTTIASEACLQLDPDGTDYGDDEDEDDDFDIADFDLDGGINYDDEEEEEDDDIDKLDPEKEGDEKITCYQCKDNQVVAQQFWDITCNEDEEWFNTPEEACGEEKKRICYGCGISKAAPYSFNQFTSQPFSAEDLAPGNNCPNEISDDFDGWYNTPEETQCNPDAPLEIVEDNNINEYTCVWCPATPGGYTGGIQGFIGGPSPPSVGYYYIQSPEEGGTFGWNESDGEPPVNVPMTDDGNGVHQQNINSSAHCSNFGTPESNFFTNTEGELQQFCYDLGYVPVISEDEIVNESDWTGDDIVSEDEPYSGPINCLYCPGIQSFWPNSAYQGGFGTDNVVGGNMSNILGLPGGNQGWWNNSGDPSGPQSSTINNPSVFAYMVEVWGWQGNPYYAGGQAQNYMYSWYDDYNYNNAYIGNEVNHGYWFLESWNNPGQGWDTEIDGPYPEGITLNPDSNLFQGINLSNCTNRIGENEVNPFTVTTYYNPDAIDMPNWVYDVLPGSNSSNDTMHSYCNANGFNEMQVADQLGYTEEDWTGIPTIDEGDCPWPKACNYGDPCPEGVDCVDNCYWGCSEALEHFGTFVGLWGFGPCAIQIANGSTDAICCDNCTSGCSGITNEFNQQWNSVIIEDVIGDQYDAICNQGPAAIEAAQNFITIIDTAVDLAQQGLTFVDGISTNAVLNDQTNQTITDYDTYIEMANDYSQEWESSNADNAWEQLCAGTFELTDFMASFLPTVNATTLSDIGINVTVDLGDFEVAGINLGQEASDFLNNSISSFGVNLGPQAVWQVIEYGINWIDCTYFNQWLELPAQTGVTHPCCDYDFLWNFCSQDPFSAWINYMVTIGIDPNVLTYQDAVLGNYLEYQSIYPAMGTSIATWQNNLFGPTLGNSYSGGSWGPYSSVGDNGWCLNGGAPSTSTGNIGESKESKTKRLFKERLQKLAGIKKRG